MRIWPSQSSVMKPNVGSTRSLVTTRSDAVALGDGRPVGHRRATQRVDADPQAGPRDGRHVDDVREVIHVLAAGSRVGRQPARARSARHAGTASNPPRSRSLAASSMARVTPGVGRAAAGRVVLEATIRGRVVGGRHDDAIGQHTGVLAVPRQDGMRQGRRGREAVLRRPRARRRRRPRAPRGRSGRPARTGHACHDP